MHDRKTAKSLFAIFASFVIEVDAWQPNLRIEKDPVKRVWREQVVGLWKRIQTKTENKMEGYGGEGHEGKRNLERGRVGQTTGDDTFERPTPK